MLLEIILILVILTITIAGYRKGIIMSLVALLILMLSCVAAFIVQQSFSDQAAAWLQPRVKNIIEEKMENVFSDTASGQIDAAEGAGITVGGVEISVQDLVNLLSQFGLDAEADAQNAAENAAEPIIEQYAERISQTLCDWLSGLIVFLVTFLTCYLVLHSMELVVNLADHIPEVRFLNHTGGGIVGFISAIFFLTILVSACLRTGILQADQSVKPVLSGIRYLAEMIS